MVVEQTELEELKSKINKGNKNIMAIHEIVKNIEEKLNTQKVENKFDNDRDKKEKIAKAFEKKQIGRPVGSWEDKRKQYLEWINQGKISEPKDQTLMYYKIKYDEDNKKYKFWDKEDFDYTR